MENQTPDTSSAPSTIWQKLSVPILVVGVALMVFFFQWLFSLMYPQDSYRVYTNWEITELTSESLLTEKGLDGVRRTIDRKGAKELYLDAIDELCFNSAGKLVSGRFVLLAFDRKEEKGHEYLLTLSQDGTEKYPVKLERLEGSVPYPDDLQDRAPYEALYTLSHHPLEELANQKPIASEGCFLLNTAGSGTIVETDREAPALKAEVEEADVWFVRSGGGWFQVTDPAQISPRFSPLLLTVKDGDSEPVIYGWLMLENPAETEKQN